MYCRLSLYLQGLAGRLGTLLPTSSSAKPGLVTLTSASPVAAVTLIRQASFACQRSFVSESVPLGYLRMKGIA
jgi:hypothetical protein